MGILLPALQKSRSLRNLQSPAGSQEWSQQGERRRECRVCLFSDHPRRQDLKTAVAFVLKEAVK